MLCPIRALDLGLGLDVERLEAVGRQQVEDDRRDELLAAPQLPWLDDRRRKDLHRTNAAFRDRMRMQRRAASSAAPLIE